MASVEDWWRVKVDCSGLNKATPPLTAAVSKILYLQYEWNQRWQTECYNGNAKAFFLIPLAAVCRPKFTFSGVLSNTSGADWPKAGSTALPICQNRTSCGKKKALRCVGSSQHPSPFPRYSLGPPTCQWTGERIARAKVRKLLSQEKNSKVKHM